MKLTSVEVAAGHQLVSILAFLDLWHLRRSLVCTHHVREMHLCLTVAVLNDILRPVIALLLVLRLGVLPSCLGWKTYYVRIAAAIWFDDDYTTVCRRQRTFIALCRRGTTTTILDL